MRGTAAVTLLAVLAWSATGCGDDPSPICEARTELHDAVDELRDLDVSDDGIASFGPAVVEVSDQLADLRSVAAAELEPDITAVESSIEALRASIEAASTPAAVIEALAMGLPDVGTAVQQLDDQLGECD